MLPERLSNVLCSLGPEKDRLCFSAVFELDDHARVVNEWFGRTIIHSDRRFSYEEAQQVLDRGKGDYSTELKKLNDMAFLLREARSAEHTSELQSLMRISYAVFCLTQKKQNN